MSLQTPLRGLHEQGGAKLGTRFGTLLPEGFTDAAAEYRFGRETVALLDTNYQAFADLEGPDRVRYLNAVITSNIKDLCVGQGTPGLLLNPQGHILAELDCYALPDRLLMASHAMVRGRTMTTLEKFIIMDDATLTDVTDRFGALAIEGPAAASVVRDLCGLDLISLADRAHGEVNLGPIPCRLIRRSHFGETGAEFIVERDQLATLWNQFLEAARARNGGPIGYAAFDVLRLEAGIPWFGADFDDQVIPHEAALETTHISFTKGCYTGQEIVERVRSRGHVNRRRVGLQFSGSAAPQPGAKLLAERKEAGQVTSAAHSPALGRVIGMGYLRREHNAPGRKLEWAGGTAEVINLPLARNRIAFTGQSPLSQDTLVGAKAPTPKPS